MTLQLHSGTTIRAPRRPRAAHCAGAGAIGLLVVLMTVGAEARERPGPRVTWPWMATQLIPSPGIHASEGTASFAARWQLTPVLYSYGIHRRLSPWRSFVVEPIVRQSGSVELFISPEYIALGEEFTERFGGRAGIRSYVPVLHRGDYLSFSFGSSIAQFQGETSVGYELGAHVLFGFLGPMLTYTPRPDGDRWLTTLHIRFF